MAKMNALEEILRDCLFLDQSPHFVTETKREEETYPKALKENTQDNLVFKNWVQSHRNLDFFYKVSNVYFRYNQHASIRLPRPGFASLFLNLLAVPHGKLFLTL